MLWHFFNTLPFCSRSRTHGSAATPVMVHPPEPLSLRCHLAALTLVLRYGYRVFHNQSQEIGVLNNWPWNTLGSEKYSQLTTVWSQTHSLRHLLAKTQYGVTKVQDLAKHRKSCMEDWPSLCDQKGQHALHTIWLFGKAFS